MIYTENDIDEYIQDYFSRNIEGIKVRLRFLLDNYVEQDYLITPDIWFCFEETRHSFMMGDLVASIIMSAVAIERFLVFLLKTPYCSPRDSNSASTKTLRPLTLKAYENGLIDDQLKDKILQVNKYRDDFVHGIDSVKHIRPQLDNLWKNASMWTDSELITQEIEEKAKNNILTLFEVFNKLHYSKMKH